MNIDFSRDCLWWAVAAVAVLATVFAIVGDPARELLQYEREALLSGEIWRVISGHLVHLGYQHTLLNLAGLVFVAILVRTEFTPREWLYVTLWGLVAIGLGFVFLRPSLGWYVGLSGMLHCWLTAGALRRWIGGHIDGVILLTVIVIKGFYEQLVGPLPGSELASGGPVAVDAHWFGMLGGMIAVWTMRLRQRWSSV